MSNPITQQNSAGWNFFVRASFAVSASAMAVGIFFMPAELWVKGYLAMGSLYLMASTFMVAKTVRDEFEARKLSSQINEAKTEKMLKDYLPE